MSKVTILGLGAMGSRMAINLLKGGHEVTVWNRDETRVPSLVGAGARAASTPRSAAAEADFVISMVRDDDASREIWLDSSTGALAGVSSTGVAIESSTVTVAWAQELARHCKDNDIAFVDAPVAGSRPQAEAAQLIYLVGGEAEIVDLVRPILMTMGAAVHHAGPAGSGAAIKLMVNAFYGVQIATLGELIGLMRRLGLDEDRGVEILTSTPVCSPAAKVAVAGMLKGSFAPMFPIELVEKDFSYALSTAVANGADVPLAEAAQQVFSRAMAQGHGEDNITGVVQLYL